MEKHLKELYGFNNFRDYQKDIIKDILNNENIKNLTNDTIFNK